MPGARGIFAGKVTRFNGRLQLAHPDFVIVDEHGAVIGGAKHNASLASASGVPLVGLYPMAGKLRTWTIADCAALALDSLAGHRGSAAVVGSRSSRRSGTRGSLPSSASADGKDGDRAGPAPDAVRRGVCAAADHGVSTGRCGFASSGASTSTRPVGCSRQFDDRLPFMLTKGQIAVSEEIMAELGRTRPMQRLLQGEVGSGKTLVALRAMLAVVDAGGQAALLAPTEVLAAQHYQTITRMLGDLASRWHARRAGACHRCRADHRVHVGGAPS